MSTQQWKEPLGLHYMGDSDFYCISCYKKSPLKELKVPVEFTEDSGITICEECQKVWTPADTKEHKRILFLCWGQEAVAYLAKEEKEESEHE